MDVRALVSLLLAVAVAMSGAISPAAAEDAQRLGPKVAPFEPRASDNERLQDAWERWIEARGPRYVSRVRQDCGECQGPLPVIRTTVLRDWLVSARDVTNDKKVRWSRAWPVDRVYRLLRKGYREAADVYVRYSKRGVPLSVAIDWSELIADEETYLTIRVRFD
jgi:hypothetical protein